MGKGSAYILVFLDYCRLPKRYTNSKSFKWEERRELGRIRWNELRRWLRLLSVCRTPFYVFLARPPSSSIPFHSQRIRSPNWTVRYCMQLHLMSRLETKLGKFRHVGRKLANAGREFLPYFALQLWHCGSVVPRRASCSLHSCSVIFAQRSGHINPPPIANFAISSPEMTVQLSTNLSMDRKRIGQVPGGIFPNEGNICPAAPCMRKGAFAWNTDLIYLFPLCLSFLSGKRKKERRARTRSLPAAPISCLLDFVKKGFTSFSLFLRSQNDTFMERC